jgi:hypothetical protein
MTFGKSDYRAPHISNSSPVCARIPPQFRRTGRIDSWLIVISFVILFSIRALQ